MDLSKRLDFQELSYFQLFEPGVNLPNRPEKKPGNAG